MKKKLLAIIFCALISIVFAINVNAQKNGITIKFSRDFGYSSIGTNEIQGLFSITSSSSEKLESIIYYIDDDILGEVLTEPYKFQFTTDDYSVGQHTIFAEGKTSVGDILRSQEITVTFVSADASRAATIKLIIPILAVTLLISILAVVIPAAARKKKGSLPLGTQRNYGSAGGAVCTKCERPFERHVMSPNLLVGKLEVCPHCGKWGVYRSFPLDALRQAEKDELKRISMTSSTENNADNENEILRKKLDESRFED
ncbi:hypothetical protein ACFLXB_00900 [Chloroflexota bacterium]